MTRGFAGAAGLGLLSRLSLLSLLSVATGAATARADLSPRTVLVMDLRASGVDAGVARTIQSTLITELSRVPGLDILSGDDVKELVKLEASRQTAGCDVDGSCLAEIADALGAQLAIFGDVGQLGSLVVVNLSLFDTKAAMSTARAKAEVDAAALATIGNALMDTLPTLLAPALTADQLEKYKKDIEDRRASDRMSGLVEKNAKGPALYIVDPHIVRMTPSVAATVTSLLAETATAEGMAVFTKDDAKVILEREADLALIGAESDQVSLTSLGKKVGTGHVVATVVSAVDDDILVSARLIDVNKSAVVARRAVKASDFKGSLVETVQAATRLVLQPVFAAEKGTLTLTTTEEGASIYVDDDLFAIAPLTGPITLPGGHHLVAIEKEGFIRYAEAIRIEKQKASERHVVLRPSPVFLENYRSTNGLLRTLAWTSVGAAVVTGAALGVTWAGYTAARTEQDQVNAKWAAIDIPSGSELEVQARRETDAAFQTATNWSYGIGATVPFFSIAVGASAFFWLYGDDPAKYDHLDARNDAE